MSSRVDQESVVGVYKTFAAAKQAVDQLEVGGFPSQQISFVTRNVDEELTVAEEEKLRLGDSAEKTAAKLATVGGMVGLVVGSPLVLVPGIGPMLWAGPLAAGLTGAIVGGFLGAMSGWGVHEDHIVEYEKYVREGQFLVVANGDPEEVALAKCILDETDAVFVRLHAGDSADSPEIDDRPHAGRT
jgi:hypothetical protein